MFACRASHNMVWSQHSNVQVSKFVTCLNFAGTGLRLWQLYVAFVMTWYLTFTTSGRTAKAVRPVISGKQLPTTVTIQQKLSTYTQQKTCTNYLWWSSLSSVQNHPCISSLYAVSIISSTQHCPAEQSESSVTDFTCLGIVKRKFMLIFKCWKCKLLNMNNL